VVQLLYIPPEYDLGFATAISQQEMEMFNSLRYTKVLEEAGVVRKQAEAHVGIMTDMMASHFATSNDLKDLRTEVSQDLKDLRNEVSQELKGFRQEFTQEIRDLRQEMQKLEYRLTIKLGTIVGALLGVTATIVTLVIKLA